MPFEDVAKLVGEHIRRVRRVDSVSAKDVAREILDRGKLHGLSVWGRTGDAALDLVAKSEWAASNIDWQSRGIRVVGGIGSYVIQDLQFDREEVNAIWPTKR